MIGLVVAVNRLEGAKTWCGKCQIIPEDRAGLSYFWYLHCSSQWQGNPGLSNVSQI